MHRTTSPDTSDGAIEHEMVAKGKTAPRVTMADIEASIASEHYFTAADGARHVTDQMVSRFLWWPLPKDFYPDCGIRFDGRKDDEWNKNKTWPVGTNLLTAEQARAMLEHVMQPQPDQPALHLLTFCVFVLRNGFTVTGESACASPENFDAEIGRKVARANAINKCWPLLGYALKERLHAMAPPLTGNAVTTRPEPTAAHQQRVIAEHAELVDRFTQPTTGA
jgi:Phage protein (N4 Gp49/phage Sf6 gene 66) family